MTTPPGRQTAAPYDQHEQHTAARIGRDHPHWLILWGTHSRLWWAYPRFRAAPGTIISAPTPGDLLTRMRHTELATTSPGNPAPPYRAPAARPASPGEKSR